MAKRRTLKRRWLEEKAKQEKLERLLNTPQIVVRSTPYKEPIRMTLRREYSRRLLHEYDDYETPKKMMIASMLCKPLGELTESEYEMWLGMVKFETVDIHDTIVYTMKWLILPM